MSNTEQTGDCHPKEKRSLIILLFIKFFYSMLMIVCFVTLVYTGQGNWEIYQNTVGSSKATNRFQEGLSFSSCHLLWTVGSAFCHAIRAPGNSTRDLLQQVPESHAVLCTAYMLGLRSFAQTRTK